MVQILMLLRATRRNMSRKYIELCIDMGEELVMYADTHIHTHTW